MDLALENLPKLADEYYKIREDRLAADKAAASLKAKENELFTAITYVMSEHDMSSVGGKVAILKRSVEEKPIAQDWDEIYRYIRENDAFDILHKRLGVGALRLRKDDDIDVPGVGWMEYDKITISKAP
jgi:hypothetical protein